MYLTIQLVRYDPLRGCRVRQPPYVTLDGAACDRFAHLAAAAGLFVPGVHQGRFYQDLRLVGEPRDPDSDGPSDEPPERPAGMGWREYNRIVDEWRTSRGLHNGERAFVLAPEQVARLAAVLRVPDLNERLLETARQAGVSPLPSVRELTAAIGSLVGRLGPLLEQAAAERQGLWVSESS